MTGIKTKDGKKTEYCWATQVWNISWQKNFLWRRFIQITILTCWKTWRSRKTGYRLYLKQNHILTRPSCKRATYHVILFDITCKVDLTQLFYTKNLCIFQRILKCLLRLVPKPSTIRTFVVHQKLQNVHAAVACDLPDYYSAAEDHIQCGILIKMCINKKWVVTEI